MIDIIAVDKKSFLYNGIRRYNRSVDFDVQHISISFSKLNFYSFCFGFCMGFLPKINLKDFIQNAWIQRQKKKLRKKKKNKNNIIGLPFFVLVVLKGHNENQKPMTFMKSVD